MTQDEIFNMAVKCYLISTGNREGFYGDALIQFAKLVAEKALAEHAMQEVQRLGQEIEQEPVAWLLTDKNINSLQVDSIHRLIDRLKHALHTDLRVRIAGQDEWFEADWLKHMVRVTPPQHMNPIAWYDPSNGVVSTDRDSPLFTPLGQVWPLYPKGEWVGLTDDEIEQGCKESWVTEQAWQSAVWWAEAKLKEKNT